MGEQVLGRPREYTGRRVTTGLRLPEPLYDRLRSVAEEREVSMNRIAEKAIAHYLDHVLVPLP